MRTMSLPISYEFAPPLVVAVEDALLAMSELSGRISASSVRVAWQRRAAWTGYARALQLQGGEIDEIDVFSWGAGVPLPARPTRHTHDDEFGAFTSWWAELELRDRDAWRDALPFTPDLDRTLPRIIQAVDLTRQYARRSRGIEPWLALPRFLYLLGVTASPLPCLIAGTKSFRLQATPSEDMLRVTLKALAGAGQKGLESLETMEAAYRASVRAIRSEYRPGKLPQLLALSLSTAVLGPASAAQLLDLSVAGAGKLLERAAGLGVLVEVSGRRSWKAYVEPTLAVALGLQRAPLGRPRKALSSPAPLSDLASTLDDFDRAMAEIEAKLAKLSAAHE